MHAEKASGRGISIFAVIIGVAINNIGTVASNLAVFLFLASHNVPMEEIRLRLHSISGLLLSAIISLGFTGIGGYCAAWIARRSPILHGGVVAVVSLLLSLLCWEPSVPLWYNIILHGGAVPAGVIGGYLASSDRKAALR